MNKTNKLSVGQMGNKANYVNPRNVVVEVEVQNFLTSSQYGVEGPESGEEETEADPESVKFFRF